LRDDERPGYEHDGGQDDRCAVECGHADAEQRRDDQHHGNVYLTAATGITEASTAKVTAGTLGMNVTGTGDIGTNNANVVKRAGAKTNSGNILFTNSKALGVTTVASNTGAAGTLRGRRTAWIRARRRARRSMCC